MFGSVRREQSGAYTCTVNNNATAPLSRTTHLTVTCEFKGWGTHKKIHTELHCPLISSLWPFTDALITVVRLKAYNFTLVDNLKDWGTHHERDSYPHNTVFYIIITIISVSLRVLYTGMTKGPIKWVTQEITWCVSDRCPGAVAGKGANEWHERWWRHTQLFNWGQPTSPTLLGHHQGQHYLQWVSQSVTQMARNRW